MAAGSAAPVRLARTSRRTWPLAASPAAKRSPRSPTPMINTVFTRGSLGPVVWGLGIDGDDDADVTVGEGPLAEVTEGIEKPGHRDHEAVLGANFGLNGVEIGPGGHQLSHPRHGRRSRLDPAAAIGGLQRDTRVVPQTLVFSRTGRCPEPDAIIVHRHDPGSGRYRGT